MTIDKGVKEIYNRLKEYDEAFLIVKMHCLWILFVAIRFLKLLVKRKYLCFSVQLILISLLVLIQRLNITVSFNLNFISCFNSSNEGIFLDAQSFSKNMCERQ